MPSNLPSSFASAAAGQNAHREGRSGSRTDGRGSNSGEWSRPGRTTNGTLTFRRPSATPVNQPSSQTQSLDYAPSPSVESSLPPPTPIGSTILEETGPRQYSREELLALSRNYVGPDSSLDVTSLFMSGWNPGHANGAFGSGTGSVRGWGKSGDSHVLPQEPDICWDSSGLTTAIGLQAMTSDEEKLFTSDVNPPIKQQTQTKDAGSALNGRKASVSQGASTSFGLASPSSASRPGTRRRETTDTNPFPSGSLASPTTANRSSRDDPSYWPGKKPSDNKEPSLDDPEEDPASRDQQNKSLPFGGMMRSSAPGGPSNPALGGVSSLWQSTGPTGPPLPGVGTFGNFALPGSGSTIGDKRPGNPRGESRLAHLIPKDSSDSMGNRSNDASGSDPGRSWRARPRTDTDPFGGDENLSGSAVLGGAQDTSPPPMAHPQLNRHELNTPIKGSAAEFGMAGLNLGSHADHDAPLSPSETNPYRSPPGERGDGDGDDGADRAQGMEGGPEHLSAYGTLPRNFAAAQGAFDGSDRSQTSSVGAHGKGFPPLANMGNLGNLGGWPSSATPDRERAGGGLGFGGAFGGSIFGPMGELQSPGLGGLGGGIFGNAGATGSLNRGSKLGSLFPPAMQAQMQHQQDTESLGSLGDSVPDLRHAGGSSSGLGAIGRGAFGEHGRDTDSPLRANRGGFNDPFSPSDAARTPATSESIPATSQSQPQGYPASAGGPAAFGGAPAGGAAPPDPQSRTMVMPDRMRWVYLDPQGHQQGPFTGLEMNDWYKANFFSPDLRVKKIEDAEFEPLGQLIRRIGNSREPFLVPQIGIPHGPPPQNAFSPNSTGAGGFQPPLPGAFPSFGRTLTAEEQNNLERRKQEEQFMMARQREFLQHGGQQGMPGKFGGMGMNPGLHHHSSAHSLQSQPSFGSMTSPIGMPPQPPIGAGPGSFQGFDGHTGPQQHHAGMGPAPGHGPGNIGGPAGANLFRDEELARLSAPERQLLAGLQGNGQPQPAGASSGDAQPGMRAQLPETDQLGDDEEGWRSKLKEFEQLRAEHDAQELEQQHMEHQESFDGQPEHITSALPPAQELVDQRADDNDGPDLDEQESEHTEPAQLSNQARHAQAAVIAAKLGGQALPGLPMPFPPPQSTMTITAPTPQRAKSNLPDQYRDARSEVSTPDIQPPPMAPWAKESKVVENKGPSLKEIQEAEARKAAEAEEIASRERRAALEQEALAARERERLLKESGASALPAGSTWGTTSPVAGGVWTKPPAAASTTPAQDRKKTLADIQREEEARKQKAREVAVQTNPAAASLGKRYADLASRPGGTPLSPASQSANFGATSPSSAAGAVAGAPGPAGAVAGAGAGGGAGWATVGAGGKVKAPPAGPSAVAAPARSVSMSTVPVKSAAGKPATAAAKPASSVAAVGGVKSEAMEEFNKWLQAQLARGITGVTDINTFASTLLAFPPVPDLIADAVYANSKTMDGRHFAQEFIRRKKLAEKGVVEKQAAPSPGADVQGSSSSSGGWNEVAKKSGAKETSASGTDSIQAAGFKVVPGRKKGKK